jgi:glucose-6-phosphate 1-dehydrogenase
MARTLIFTLFGATGDLAQKKIMPALLALYTHGRLSEQFFIIAFSRRAWTDQEFRDYIRPYLEKLSDEHTLSKFLRHVIYSEGQFTEKQAYETLATRIRDIEKEAALQKNSTHNLFYFAVRPEFYIPILSRLHDSGLVKDISSKILVEKPFGSDEISARDLESQFEQKISCEQLLHVDHYLAKEGLLKIIETRKENHELEKQLSHISVQKIHVRIWEKIGIEGRGELYETLGAIRDVGQNHVLQMLATLMMDITQDENSSRTDVINSLSVVGEAIFGQYDGYLEEKNVKSRSKTETFFRLTLKNSLERWKNVEIVIEAGKAMPVRVADVTIVFKNGSKHVFDVQQSLSGRDAYEILIEEAMLGNDDYFASFEEIIAAWKLLDPVISRLATDEVTQYPKGTTL